MSDAILIGVPLIFRGTKGDPVHGAGKLAHLSAIVVGESQMHGMRKSLLEALQWRQLLSKCKKTWGWGLAAFV